MTKPKEPPPPPGRYTYDQCVMEIRAMTRREGLNDKDVLGAVGIEQTAYSKRINGIGGHFTVEEFGRIAEFFSRRTGLLLQGWPFVSYDACLQSERKLKKR